MEGKQLSRHTDSHQRFDLELALLSNPKFTPKVHKKEHPWYQTEQANLGGLAKLGVPRTLKPFVAQKEYEKWPAMCSCPYT
jgi:hypothetical protein